MAFRQDVGKYRPSAAANFSTVWIGWLSRLASTLLESQQRNYIAAVRDPGTGHANSAAERQVIRMMLG
jgi:hypothetical protein